MAIYFHDEGIEYHVYGKKEIRKWINRVIENEGKETGDINIIFTTDSYLLEINYQYLNRNYYTDIITFDYSDGKNVSGDLFVSIERIRENARSLNVKMKSELTRIIVHGVLHLIGYNDSNQAEKEIMTEKEDKYIRLLNEGI